MSNSSEIRNAVKDAGHALAEHLRPGGPDCEATVEKLWTTLGNNDVATALLTSDADEKVVRRARAQRIPIPLMSSL